LLIVKNYTGDRLHFGIAAEQAKREGYKVAPRRKAACSIMHVPLRPSASLRPQCAARLLCLCVKTAVVIM